MSCRRIQAELSAYLDEELPEAAVEAVREHVAHCLRCEAELARLERLHAALHRWEAPDVTRDFLALLAARLDAEAAARSGEAVPVEVAARALVVLDRASAERQGLREAARPAAETHESRSAEVRRAAKWSWVVAATLALAVGMAYFLRRPGELGEGGVERDVSMDLVPRSRQEAPDRIHFVLPAEERALYEAEEPDAYRLVALAGARWVLLAIEAGDLDLERVRRDLAVLSAEGTGRAMELGLVEPSGGSSPGTAWDLPILGEPAWADEAPPELGSDPDYREGLEAYGEGRFLEAARGFERLERKRPGSASAATGLAHQVRALGAAGDFGRAGELVRRLSRDYPLHRELAAALEARLVEAEANRILVNIERKNLQERGDLESRWRLALAQVRAWDLPAAAVSIEEFLATPEPFRAEPVRASRCVLLLVAVYNWMGKPRSARSVALRLEAEGASPFRELGAIEAGLLGGLEDLDPAAPSGSVWRPVRALVRFLVGLEALRRRGDVAAARAAFEAALLEDPESRLARYVREELLPALPETG